MIGTRLEERTHDGYLTVIDPERGIGLICEPLARRPKAGLRDAAWRVTSLFLLPDKGSTADFTTDYGRN